MSEVPARYAAGGRIQTNGEDDFLQFQTSDGNVVHWIDAEGVARGADFMTPGASLKALSDQVQALQFTGLPSVIDTGTF